MGGCGYAGGGMGIGALSPRHCRDGRDRACLKFTACGRPADRPTRGCDITAFGGENHWTVNQTAPRHPWAALWRLGSYAVGSGIGHTWRNHFPRGRGPRLCHPPDLSRTHWAKFGCHGSTGAIAACALCEIARSPNGRTYHAVDLSSRGWTGSAG